MLSFIVIASLVLPSVLGGCCFPKTVSAVAFRAGTLGSYTFAADFTMGKYYVKPSAGPFQYIMGDLKTKTDYYLDRNGVCTYEPSTFPLRSCIPDTAAEGGQGTLAGTIVKTFIMNAEGRRLTVVVTPDNCHPVMYFRTIEGETTSVVFTNVTTSVPEPSILTMSTADCIEKSIED